MSEISVKINGLVAEIRNGDPVVFMFDWKKPRSIAELGTLYTAYYIQAWDLIKAADLLDCIRHKARMFGKAAYAMRQAAEVESFMNVKKARGEQ